MHEVSLVRLYTLRVCYLVLAAGLGTFMWPMVLRHSAEFAATEGVRFALLGGLGLTAVLGLRYPVQMIPLLLFELLWKTVYLVFFALPLYLHGPTPASVLGDTPANSRSGHLSSFNSLDIRLAPLRAAARGSLAQDLGLRRDPEIPPECSPANFFRVCAYSLHP